MTNKELQEYMEDIIKLRFDHVEGRFDRLEDELKTMKARYFKLTVAIAAMVAAGGQAIDLKAISSILPF